MPRTAAICRVSFGRALALSSLALACAISASSANAAEGTAAKAEVRVLKDLPYKPDAASEYERERCQVDLYLPAAGKDFPTLVWFHGGGLQGGDKSSAVALGKRFASEGIAVAAVNYRLSPQVKYPAYIEDAAAAVSFVRREIVKQGGSPQQMFISGHSAGGYLTAMLGLDEQYLVRHNLKLADIAGLLPISGQMITHSTVRQERGIVKTQPLIDSAAPAYYVRKDAPPMLVIAGSEDLPARAEESRYFVAALKAAGHEDATYLEFAGRDHGSIANQIPNADDTVALAMLEFIRQHSAEPQVIRIMLKADTQGGLAEILLDGELIESTADGQTTRLEVLQSKLLQIARGSTDNPQRRKLEAVVSVNSDRLKYEHVINVITALTKYQPDPDGQEVRLLSKIKFEETRD